MTIKELYEYAKINGFDNLPFRYGYIDDDGVYRPHNFDFSDFEYDAEEATMLFSKDALKKINEELVESVTMEYNRIECGVEVFCCSYCQSETFPTIHDYNYCSNCGKKIKKWE